MLQQFCQNLRRTGCLRVCENEDRNRIIQNCLMLRIKGEERKNILRVLCIASGTVAEIQNDAGQVHVVPDCFLEFEFQMSAEFLPEISDSEVKDAVIGQMRGKQCILFTVGGRCRLRLFHDRRRKLRKEFFRKSLFFLNHFEFQLVVKHRRLLPDGFQRSPDCIQQRSCRREGRGIGLFRTESLFRNRTEPPGEEEQLRIYSSAARQLGGHPMTVRTASLGAHSQVSCVSYEEEPNPAMGVRGIRFSLDHPDLFCTQLRAVLRAAADSPIGLTFPMVTGVEELHHAKELLRRAMEELRDRNVPFCENIRVGVMVDTPASALIAEALAREVDFFDVGTNGLTQFALAADRANPALTTLYDFHHPAVLELVRRAVFAAKNAGIPAVICGDAAADPLMLGFFLSLGVEALSVAPSSVLELRRAVRSME